MISTNELLVGLEELFPNPMCELQFDSEYELLVAVILSAQCTDRRVNQVTKELFKKYNTPKDFASLKQEELEKLIYSCGFYHNKAKNIIAASKAIVELYDGKVPDTFDEIIKLPGVGEKTAKVVLAVAFNRPGVAVDTHVGRIARRLGLTKETYPSKVSHDLESMFDKKDWNRLHYMMVLFGRYYCKAHSPKCDGCKFAKNCNFNKK